ncbi:MAG: hypothetical protein AB1758_09375 [Candidatus Eremiobacterota bacterium]
MSARSGDRREERYLDTLEAVIEDFGRIQREFVLSKNGIRAVVRLIEEMSGTPPVFDLSDPVVQKGRKATFQVISELDRLGRVLASVRPPAAWERFHRTLLESLGLQLDGYREMVLVFEDRSREHLRRGQRMVDQGLGRLAAGTRSVSAPSG